MSTAFGTVNLVPVLNNISYIAPSAPFLTQPSEAPWCDEYNKPQSCFTDEVCVCPHLVHVPYGHLIDIIVVDDTDSRLRT